MKKKWRDNNLHIWDYRMLTLMEELSVEMTGNEFLKSIGFSSNNIGQVYNNKQSFKHEHFFAASKRYKISMDWFYGFTEQKKRQPSRTVEELLSEALKIVKNQSSGV